jgi:hypothetical protein
VTALVDRRLAEIAICLAEMVRRLHNMGLRFVGKAMRLTLRLVRMARDSHFCPQGSLGISLRLTGMSPRLARMALRLNEGSETDWKNDEFGLIGSGTGWECLETS